MSGACALWSGGRPADVAGDRRQSGGQASEPGGLPGAARAAEEPARCCKSAARIFTTRRWSNPTACWQTWTRLCGRAIAWCRISAKRCQLRCRPRTWCFVVQEHRRLSELATLGKPGLLVPLPPAIGKSPQEVNAAMFERKRAGLVIKNADLEPNLLAERVNYIMASPELLALMMEVFQIAREAAGNARNCRRITEISQDQSSVMKQTGYQTTEEDAPPFYGHWRSGHFSSGSDGAPGRSDGQRLRSGQFSDDENAGEAGYSYRAWAQPRTSGRGRRTDLCARRRWR